MTELKLQNSLSGKKEKFTPLDPENIRIYACGPTVYNYAHIGNARMAVIFDVLANILRSTYPKVTYVSNITDIDDKIIKASQDTKQPIDNITKKYTKIYNDDMAALGVAPPDIQPLATDNIPQMIEIIKELIEKGHAYVAEGHVLFNVPSFPKYGGLSGRSRDEQIAGARVDVASYKKDPADFILWKPSDENEPAWDSPWGKGRPGWHIECSAMAERYLGLPFDIHGGGADLKFPHHENEIAQSCCSSGNCNDLSSFAKYWVHNGFVTVNGDKMSKSIGNVTLVHDLIDNFEGETLRFTLLSAHYRQPLDWSENSIKQSKQTLDKIYRNILEISDIEIDVTVKPPKEFMSALCDDLNTPKAISILIALSKEAAKAKTQKQKSEFFAAAKILNIAQQDPETWLGHCVCDDSTNASHIDSLLQERQQARADKNYARSDEIRDELLAMGIAIEDTPDGAIWKRI